MTKKPNKNKKIAVITWWTSGIGAEFAYQLAKNGYTTITLVGRNQNKAQHVIKKLKNIAPEEEYTFFSTDLSQQGNIGKLIKYITNLPKIDLLINNAGFGHGKSFTQAERMIRDSSIMVHVMATMQLSYTALKKMETQHYGNIINVSSLASFLGVGAPIYTATKWFIRQFSENLYYEYKEKNIYIQALCPWYIKTDFFNTAHITTPKHLIISAEKLVQYSLEAMKKKKSVCIPWKMNKVLRFFLRLLPNSRVFRIIKKKIPSS